MRMRKMVGSVAVAGTALAAMAGQPVLAANWDPQGSVVHGHGTVTLATNAFGAVTCTVTVNAKATGDVARTTDTAGSLAGPTFSGCTNNISPGLSTAVTTTAGAAGAWSLTATSTTAVDTTNFNLTIEIGGICTETAMGVSMSGNTWSNTVHSLTLNSAATFPIVESGLCDGGSTMHMSGSINFQTSMTVT